VPECASCGTKRYLQRYLGRVTIWVERKKPSRELLPRSSHRIHTHNHHPHHPQCTPSRAVLCGARHPTHPTP
jgi:hypothetical protein